MDTLVNPMANPLEEIEDKAEEDAIVRRHGQIFPQPFNQEGLRVESLHLEVDPLAQFRLQPCRFIIGAIFWVRSRP